MAVLVRWSVALLLAVVWVTGRAAHGQAPGYAVSSQQVRMALLHGADVASAEAGTAAARERSPMLALSLSAAVPGLGQAYNRDWIKAGLHAAVEAALWTGIATWRARGNAGIDAYKAFAHAEWSPLQYARWLNDYQAYQNVMAQDPVDVMAYTDIDFRNPGAWSEADEAAVRQLFNEIRRLERVMTHDVTGASFSHLLPFFGEQQYYELIGKYYQFAPGWCDYGDTVCGNGSEPWYDAEGNPTEYMSPNEHNISDRFQAYASDHQAANDLLRRASRVTALVLLNHLVAGVEAAVSARLHNVRIESEMTSGFDGGVAWRTAVAVQL